MIQHLNDRWLTHFHWWLIRNWENPWLCFKLTNIYKCKDLLESEKTYIMLYKWVLKGNELLSNTKVTYFNLEEDEKIHGLKWKKSIPIPQTPPTFTHSVMECTETFFVEVSVLKSGRQQQSCHHRCQNGDHWAPSSFLGKRQTEGVKSGE